MRIALYIFLIAMILPQISCKNMFEDFSDKNTDDALLYSAKINMNAFAWDLAIADFVAMSAAYKDEREVRMQHAKAYAGRCGLELLGLFETLAATDLTTARLFGVLMDAFPASTISDVDDCIISRDLILGISTTPTERTGDENMSLAFISFAVIGTMLNAYADVAPEDQITDLGFDGCSGGTIPDPYLRELGLSFGIASKALYQADQDGALGGAGELTEVSAVCTVIDAGITAPAEPIGFCEHTTAAALPAIHVNATSLMIIDIATIGINPNLADNRCILGGTCSLQPVACP